MTKILVSVIIVNYNGKEFLKVALESLKKSIFRDFEIIVVDNASTDGSQEFLREKYSKLKLVKNKTNLGYSGINRAIRYCKGKYILFLNNDMFMDSYCIKALLHIIKSDDDIFQVCPRFVNYYDKNLKSSGTWVSRAFYSGHIPTYDKKAKEIPYLGMGLVRKEVVDYFNYLFDPDYFIYAEDLDLGLRIRLMGKKVVFVPDAIIYHMHSATMQSVEGAKKTFLLERNLLITFFKLLSLRNIFKFFPYLLIIRFIATLKDILSGRIKNAFARIRAMLWILSHFDLVLKKRKQTQRLRIANDDFVLKIFTEKYLFSKKFLV